MVEAAVLFQPPGFVRKSTFSSSGRINYYESRPEANPTAKTMVFLHGFGGGSSSYEWSKVYPAFAADYRVLAPDLPGWGFSEHRDSEYGKEDYLRAIGEFLADVAGGRAIVIASSVVAALTLRLSTEQPEYFEAIVAMNPSGLSDFGKPYDGSFFGFVSNLPGINQFVYSQLITTTGGIRDFLRRSLFVRENRISEEIVDAYHASASEPNGQYAAYSFLRGNFSFDLAEWMPRLTVPVAILWGAQSKYASPDTGERLAALSNQVRFFKAIEDVGLTPQLELPATTVSAIREALAALAIAV
ncbi:alpha/beta fold hydrolase [Gloeobacter morelensis]|uniref:Alpha/beta hydrolase n=1 Tax=Gloeobacter morelensis MG652769 TaxID=2781736 RepID=A0ABY3PIG1_9CYAN|nr:alpha/beta hydrolase [Gloeobacter morelensis]UFP93463.1 alpha/beta hydrolase [Gloeobacter morelensis MG652769]